MSNFFSLSGFSSLGTALLIGIAVFIVLRISGLARSGQSVFQIGRAVRLAVEAPVKLAIRPLLWLAFKIPGVERAGKWLWSRMTDEALEGFFNRIFRKSKRDLLRGDLMAYAARRWPKERFPHLWMVGIPEDLKRPLVSNDGRLIDGSSPASVMAPNFVDTVLVGQAFRRAVLAGLFWALVGLLVWHPQTYLGKTVGEGMGDAAARQMQIQPPHGENRRVFGSDLPEDAWSFEAVNAKMAEQEALQAKVLEARHDSIMASAPGGSITSVLFGILVFFGTWRGLVQAAAQQRVEPLRRQMKENVVRYKYRFADHAVQYRAYLAQLKTAMEWDKTELIEIGKASGMFRFRGQLGAPEQGQPMRFTLQDASQHILVTGGTGAGKTRAIILPVVKQILAIRKRKIEAGETRAISIYGTDGKAVLWRDIKQAAEEMGQGDDVRVIGCNEASGEFGVDLLEGVDPQLVSDIIRSVMRQTTGEGASDSFWPDMAAIIIKHAAIINRAWELTNDGLELVSASGERIYSLVMIYQLALDPEVQERAVKAILAAIEDPQQWPIMEPFATVELFDSIRYMRSQWTTMADATKTGITANITNAMAPFASNAKLRAAFASGRSQNLMKIADTWGAICLANVSSLEFGLAGRIVLVMLKTLLYTEARKREMADPSVGFREKLLFVADEFQDLITADMAGLSDSTYWNVARSNGTIGLCACQSLAALEQAVGRVSAENFSHQMRNKIFLRVEDPSTMAFAKSLAGKSLRFHTFESDRYESYDAMVRETGHDPMQAGPARIVELPDNVIGALASGWLQVHKASLPLSFDTWKAAVEVDLRFVPSGGLMGHRDDSHLAAEQAAWWRRDDLVAKYMADGNHQADVLCDEDLILMGSAFCYAFLQRSGVTRQDLVEV